MSNRSTWALRVMLGCLAVVAVVLLALAGPSFPATVSGSLGNGVGGTFFAERKECSKTCHLHGTFVSQDGHELFTAYLYGGALGRHHSVGEQIPAVDSGVANQVFPKSGNYEWIVEGLVLAAGVAYLVGVGRHFIRRGRPQPPATEGEHFRR